MINETTPLSPGMIAAAGPDVESGDAEREHGRASSPRPTPRSRPNVILVVADDLDARTFEHLPSINDLIRKRGAWFSRFYVTTPICCPARASIFSGQYAHNHGVLRNNAQHGGFHTFYLEQRERSTLATWLQDVGYRTALVGKYLNGYPRLPRRLTDA